MLKHLTMVCLRCWCLIWVFILFVQGISTAAPPDPVFDLKLIQRVGHERGYSPPPPDSSLELRLSELLRLTSQLKFFSPQARARAKATGKEFGEGYGYVPLEGPLKIVEVVYEDKEKTKFKSLRAQSGKPDTHGVRLEIERYGAKNDVRGWILIEARQKISGVLYLEGTVKAK